MSSLADTISYRAPYRAPSWSRTLVVAVAALLAAAVVQDICWYGYDLLGFALKADAPGAANDLSPQRLVSDFLPFAVAVFLFGIVPAISAIRLLARQGATSFSSYVATGGAIGLLPFLGLVPFALRIGPMLLILAPGDMITGAVGGLVAWLLLRPSRGA